MKDEILIKVEKKASNQIEMVVAIVKLLLSVQNERLSDNEIYILSYFILKGYNKATRDFIVEEAKLSKNKQALSNIISKFRGKGLIIREEFDDNIHPSLRFANKDTKKLGLQVVFNNK